MRLHLADDSGIIGLIDCSAYVPFVGEDWEYEQLFGHFGSQAADRSIVVWDAGDGGNDYRVDVVLEAIAATGYREGCSQIAVLGGELHMASYTAISMAAQYADEPLPAKDETQCCVSLANGEYAVRVIQMYDPTRCGDLPEDDPHFVVELLRSSSTAAHGNVIWL